MVKQPDYRELVHSPAELAHEHVQWARRLNNTPGVPFGIPAIDEHVIPLHPGDMAVFVARPGHAKCFAPGTMVLMFDGSRKAVEDVLVGDRLMGPDSLPRTVTTLGNGTDEMYEVVPVKGDSYTVNSEHVLTLQMSGYDRTPTGTVVNLTVQEYLARSDKFRSKAKGYRAAVDWAPWPVPIEPYWMGLWLGDGSAGNTSITTVDEPVIDYLREYAGRLGMRFSATECRERCTYYNIVGQKGAKNPIRENLRELGIFKDKNCIPNIYKMNDRSVRLELLAGLIDTDGSYWRHNLSITQKRRQLAEDIAFLCRSLGFAAYISECQNTCTNTGATGTYYRVNISGDLSQIPTRLPRKQVPPRRQVKSVLRTGITVRPVGRGEYYGFELAGPDRRFLLADFTVVHNTAMLAYLARAEAKRIQERKTVDTEAVVYVTWEQVTEEINGVLDVTDAYTVNDLARGKADIAKVEEHSTKRAGLPIWIIGDSLARTNAKSPRMYPETVFQAIESMADDYGVRPTLLCFDYIQLVPIPRQGDRQKQVIEAAHGCKELAKRAGAPAAVAVQARREVDERNVKIPGLWDAQWSSSIEQAADKYFGLWRPWQTERHKDANGGPMYVDGGNGTRYEVKPTLLFMTMHKQR
ncbi:MAG TPA: Hint domain-containing homing endonuclease, partial [Thiobacillus sp.]|nr:Hint domain-containing homing endonuclease [Thiobacillus sp.]